MTMTIVHAVMIIFALPPTMDEQSIIRDAANAMVDSIPQIQKLRCGFDLGLNGAIGAGSFSLIAEFASVADYEVYKAHAVHRGFVETYLKPRMVSRTATQFEIE